MKKNNNIKQLKKWMINRSTDSIRCRIYGVQAYGISKQEYNVIVEFAKQGGRYYFIDRDGNRFLASRYEDAERVAGEIVENVQVAFNVAIDLTREFMTTGKVNVDSELIDLFLELCDVSGLEYESRKFHVTDEGDCYTTYILKGGAIKTPEQTAKDDAQSEENAADEQQTENDEQGNESNENGENAAACEPSKFSGILAKMKNGAKAAAEKAAFVFSLVVFFAIGLLSIYGAMSAIASIVEALGICGSICGALLGSVLVLTVGLDFMAFVVINTMAILSRFFPSEFEKAQKPHFTKYFSFWYRLINESL